MGAISRIPVVRLLRRSVFIMKRKELLAAGYVKDFRFSDPGSLDLYLYQLAHRRIKFKILERCNSSDGSILIRIVLQYNDAPLIDLYE